MIKFIKGYGIRHDVIKHLLYEYSLKHNLDPYIAYCRLLSTKTYDMILNDEKYDVYLRTIPALYTALECELAGDEAGWLHNLME